MKWNNNDVTYKRGSHETILFKFDNDDKWYTSDADIITEQAQKSAIKLFADYMVAHEITAKYMWNQDDEDDETPSENLKNVFLYRPSNQAHTQYKISNIEKISYQIV